MCLTLEWLKDLLVFVVVIAAVIAVLRLLIPWVVGLLGISPGPLPQIINIIVTAIIVIAVIIIVFDLLSCLMGSAHLRLQ
jgi:hypothetical protein